MWRVTAFFKSSYSSKPTVCSINSRINTSTPILPVWYDRHADTCVRLYWHSEIVGLQIRWQKEQHMVTFQSGSVCSHNTVQHWKEACLGLTNVSLPRNISAVSIILFFCCMRPCLVPFNACMLLPVILFNLNLYRRRVEKENRILLGSYNMWSCSIHSLHRI